MKTVVLTVNEIPFPLNSGGKIDVYHQAKTLKALGYKVLLIGTYSQDKDFEAFCDVAENICDEYYFYPRKKIFKSFIKMTPYFVVSSEPNLLEQQNIQKLIMIQSSKIVAIIVNHLYSYVIGRYISNMVPYAKYIYRMQNIETTFLLSVYKSLPVFQIRKYVIGLDIVKMYFFEKTVFNEFHKIGAISFQEMELLKIKFPSLHIEWIPPFFDFQYSFHMSHNEQDEYDKLIAECLDKKVILLAAGFSSGFNVDTTKDFCKKSLPKIIEQIPSVLLIIAGKDADLYFESNQNIRVIPNFFSIKPLVKRADLSLVLATGKGGVKLKLMEAVAYKKMIVSSFDGVYGSGLEQFIPHSDNYDILAELCIDRLNGTFENKNNALFEYFNSQFEPIQSIQNLLS